MKEVIIIFLFVAVVATIGLTAIDDEYNFPTGNAMLRRCTDNTECRGWEYCENVNGGDGGVDGRRGKQCRAKFSTGTSCFEHFHCRTNFCNPKKRYCDMPQKP